MNKENVHAANIQWPIGQVARARATDVGPAVQAKRRVVLKDISNNPLNGSNIKVVNGVSAQTNKAIKKCTTMKNEQVTPSIRVEPRIQKRRKKSNRKQDQTDYKRTM